MIAKAKLRIHQKKILAESLILEMKLWEVPKSSKYPDGIKYGLIVVNASKRLKVFTGKIPPWGKFMKKLIISMKSTDDLFVEFKQAAKNIKSGKAFKETFYEIAFEDQKDFNKFVKNISILMDILKYRPHSIYQLAKLTDRDLSNVKKIVTFFEEIGAVQIKIETVAGRTVKRPIVDYDRVEFDLKAA